VGVPGVEGCVQTEPDHASGDEQRTDADREQRPGFSESPVVAHVGHYEERGRDAERRHVGERVEMFPGRRRAVPPREKAVEAVRDGREQHQSRREFYVDGRRDDRHEAERRVRRRDGVRDAQPADEPGCMVRS